MYRLKISGNFFLILNDGDLTEHSRHPLKDVRYQIYNENLLDPTINFFGLEGQFNTKSNEADKFESSELLDENGDPFTSLAVLYDFLDKNTGGQKLSNSGNPIVDLATNDIGRDAWGRPKSILDRSIFHGMFTYNVPVITWEECFNGVFQPFTNATSLNGKLNLVAGATLNDVTRLKTFRNPRYEPNRGHLYSSSVFLPNPNALGNRRLGYFTDESGAFFSLESGTLYAVVRTTINTVTSEDKYPIDLTGVDLSKGNLFDIQMQWRGVGNYKFFINLKLVKEIEYAGTRVDLTMFNPANPLGFECENLGDNVVLECGCVDVTSEGGDERGKTYGSIGMNSESGEVAIPGPATFNTPILAVRSKLTVGGLINTRDTLALLASAYSDEKSVVRIWATRDFTAITENSQVWQDFGDGHLEYITYDIPDVATPMTFDTAKAELIFGSRVDANNTYSTSALFEGRTDIYLTVGDMFVFTVHRENGGAANVGVTFEFAEEI